VVQRGACDGEHRRRKAGVGGAGAVLRRHLMRAVETFRPMAFSMENGPQLLTSQDFIDTKTLAQSLDFRVVGRVLNAADHAVPQTRRRAIGIGLFGAIAWQDRLAHGDPAIYVNAV